MTKAYYQHTGYPGRTVTFKGSKSIKNLAVQCPECKKAGRFGTLEKLTEAEYKKLSEREKDNLPKVIFGCDECKYWIDGDIL